jgi:putative thioredoxin
MGLRPYLRYLGCMSESAAASPWVIDVTDADFEARVIERSKEVPVVVDFWAPWCGPCKALGPLLERLADEHAGAFVLARVNTDENPGLAGAFRVQSIPMVIGVDDGKLAGHFVGALPESGVRDFLAQLMPTDAERLADEGATLLANGKTSEAEASFRLALDTDARADGALVGLATILSERDAADEALALLDRVGPGPRRQDADRLAAALRIRQSGGADEAALRARVDADPNDIEARFALAQVLAASARYDQALEHYLAIVKKDRSFQDDGARKAMIDIFDLLGPGNEVADRYRSDLAKVLFS